MESGFSISSYLITKTRTKLTGDIIKKVLLLKSWKIKSVNELNEIASLYNKELFNNDSADDIKDLVEKIQNKEKEKNKQQRGNRENRPVIVIRNNESDNEDIYNQIKFIYKEFNGLNIIKDFKN